MRRALLPLLLLGMAPAALAGYMTPQFERTQVRVAVGESVKVRVKAVYVYFAFLPTDFSPWDFESGNRRVAAVSGSMVPDPGAMTTMTITGRSPGKTVAKVKPADGNNVVQVTVYCPDEPPVQPAEAHQRTKLGETVTLRAVTQFASRTTFTWYRGPAGDMSSPIAAGGPEIPFTAGETGLHHVWVMATTACSTTTAQFAVEAFVPKRRTARH